MSKTSQEEGGDVRQDSSLRNKWLRLAIISTLLLALAAAVSLMVGLLWYLSPETALSITERKDLVQGLASAAQALAVFFTGAVGLISLMFTWRSLRQTRDSTQKTLELTEQGQITERFTRAIDQLGATNATGDNSLEIRLGGIYTLERIDKESAERAYHSIVMEVLTAYVRENAPRIPAPSNALESPKGNSALNPAPNNDVVRGESEEQITETTSPPTADIRAILDVFKRREKNSVSQKHRVRFDLRETCLVEADLRSADLQGTIFGEADLRGARLQGADLLFAYLRGANLLQADLRGAYLFQAELRGADLRGAILREADLRRADLQGADLRGADLRGADLKTARNVTQEQIEWTIGDDNRTGLPDNLDPPEGWSKDIEEQTVTIRKELEQS